MSAPHCPSPDRKGVDVATYTVHPAAVSPDSEDLADALDREHRAHEATGQALVEANVAHDRVKADLNAVFGVLAFGGEPPAALTAVGADALNWAQQALSEKDSLLKRCVTYEEALVEATRERDKALAEATHDLERSRLLALAARAVLSVCDSVTEVGQTEERLHELGNALHNLRAVLGGEPSPLVVGVDLASGPDVTVVVRAPPEAFTRAHAVDDEMPGLPGGEDGDND